jgi:hypothetical protein
MKVILGFLLFFLLFPIVSSYAGSGYYEDCFFQTGDKISIFVSGQASRDTATEIFSYSFTIKSNPQSEQNVWVFDIILREKGIIISAGSPFDWGGPGWSGKPTKYSDRREIKPPYKIVWTAPEGKDIKPSEIVSGFTFQTSFGIPGIVDYYAEGDAYAWCPEGMAVDFITGYDDLTTYGPGIVGKTIGPTAPPADFKPVDFLNYVINLKHQSTSLGWIKNAGIENSLDAKLDNAKNSLENGDTKAAKNILNALINEVEGQGCETYEKCTDGKHLTPEAYALLKYNVQYLIEKL